jgi:toxin secretion/phage lysis holin
MGISKKVMMFVLVALGNIIDQHIIGSGGSLRTMLIMFYLSNEGISIIENAGKMGLPLPQKLKKLLVYLRQKNLPEVCFILYTKLNLLFK